MSVSTLNGSSENPQPIKVERKMQNIKMGKDTGHQPPKLSATNLRSLKKGRDVYLGPPSNRYPNCQSSDTDNNGVFWKFVPFGHTDHELSDSCGPRNSDECGTSSIRSCCEYSFSIAKFRLSS